MVSSPISPSMCNPTCLLKQQVAKSAIHHWQPLLCSTVHFLPESCWKPRSSEPAAAWLAAVEGDVREIFQGRTQI